MNEWGMSQKLPTNVNGNSDKGYVLEAAVEYIEILYEYNSDLLI